MPGASVNVPLQTFCTWICPFCPSCAAAGMGAAKMQNTMAAKPAVDKALNVRNSGNLVMVENTSCFYSGNRRQKVHLKAHFLLGSLEGMSLGGLPDISTLV